MQKALAFLEKNVQWIALGLGGVYLLWMIWSYVLTPPISTEVGNVQDVTLRNIDKLTLEGPAQRLQNAMDVSTEPTMAVQEYVKPFIARIQGTEQFPLLAGIWTASQAAPIQVASATPNGDNQGGPRQPNRVTAQLPQIPAPVYMDKSEGLSSIALPAGDAQPGAMAQPMPPRPAQGGADPNALPPHEDRQWVTTGYKVAMAPLAASFEKAGVPQELRTTYFLRVEAVREELDSDGKWSNPTVVKPLSNQPLPPMPTDFQGEGTYGDWAVKNQLAILQPSFYQVIAADPWVPPGYKPPVDTTFDPANPPAREWTPEEHQLRQRYLQEQQRQRQQNEPPRQPRRPRQPTPPRNLRGIPSDATRNPYQPAPRDLEREALAQANPPGRNPGRPGSIYDDPDELGYYPGTGPQGRYQPGQPASPQTTSSLPPPTGAFQPANQPDVEIWVHDDTVQPGKTYRYKVRYAIKNPLYRIPNIVENRKDADQFALWSEYSDYSTAIDVKDLTNFFVAANMGGSPVITFDVFRWQNGQQNKQTVRASAGDMIGALADNGVDYRTGWTVVDVRENPSGDTYVILMDPQGHLMRRDYRSDQKKELYQQLKHEAEAARLSANAAGPGGGMGAR